MLAKKRILNVEVIIHKAQTPTDPTLAECGIACSMEAASPPGQTASVGVQVDLGRAPAQQRTSRLHINTHFSLSQAAGLVPPLNGQRKSPRGNVNGKTSRRLIFSRKNLYTQKRLKEGKKKDPLLPPPSCPSNSLLGRTTSHGWQIKPQITRHNSW